LSLILKLLLLAGDPKKSKDRREGNIWREIGTYTLLRTIKYGKLVSTHSYCVFCVLYGAADQSSAPIKTGTFSLIIPLTWPVPSHSKGVTKFLVLHAFSHNSPITLA